jgi:hypothetical protein
LKASAFTVETYLVHKAFHIAVSAMVDIALNVNAFTMAFIKIQTYTMTFNTGCASDAFLVVFSTMLIVKLKIN